MSPLENDRATVGDVTPEPDEPFVPHADAFLAHNAKYVEHFKGGELPLRPAKRMAIVACMDSRMDIFEMLGLGHGEAHVIRNAGGVVTDDVIRSLVVSQRGLGTKEIVLLHHTNCGLQQAFGDALHDEIEAETGIRPQWSLESFKDPFQDVAQSIRRLHVSPFIPNKDFIRGFVYQVEDGRLVEVTP